MVELEPLEERDAEQRARRSSAATTSYTQSAVAWRVLSGWKEYVQQFVKVMPVEYRQVLAKQHLDSDAAKLASI